MQKKPDLYQQITDQIINAIESGMADPEANTLPWQALGSGGMPMNAVTSRPYSGINVLLLCIAKAKGNYTSRRWLTFKQARELGGSVRAGEHGAHIIFVKQCTKKTRDTETGDETEESYTALRGYTVFNVCQCEGLPASVLDAPKLALTPRELDAALVSFRDATGADIRHAYDNAFYHTHDDYIGMPKPEQFESEGSYWATLAHELTHWTGHKNRINRDLVARFGEAAYAAEELIAEIGAAFLCADLGIKAEVRHEDYIAYWLKILKSDKKAIVTAAAQASKAATFLRELAGKPAVTEEMAEAA